MSGWSVAKSHFKKVETAQRTIVGPDGYFAESAAKQELLQVANLSEPDYYTMCGSHRFSVIYDEKRLDGVGRCVEVLGRQIAVEPEKSTQAFSGTYFLTPPNFQKHRQ
jgi:hypothetical protein